MNDLLEISELEQVYHRLNKLIAEMQTLQEFVLARLPNKYAHKPKTERMFDPRTGKPFKFSRQKKSRAP